MERGLPELENAWLWVAGSKEDIAGGGENPNRGSLLQNPAEETPEVTLAEGKGTTGAGGRRDLSRNGRK